MSGGVWGEGRGLRERQAFMVCTAGRVPCWSAGCSVPSSGQRGRGSHSSRPRGREPSTVSEGPSLHPPGFSGEVAVTVKSVTPLHACWASLLRSPILLSVFSHCEPPGSSQNVLVWPCGTGILASTLGSQPGLLPPVL